MTTFAISKLYYLLYGEWKGMKQLLKSREIKEGWMKNDEVWMKNDEVWMENDEGWKMNDDGWWFQAVEGFW